MGNFELSAVSALDGYTGSFDTTYACEVGNLVIVSITIPRGGLQAVNSKLSRLWQTTFPNTGECIRIGDAQLAGQNVTLVLYGLQSDQCFLVAETDNHSTQNMLDHLNSELGPVAYLTDQSDSWAVLDIDGALTITAMERICMLDLASYTSSQVARTTMEHLSVIVEKQGDERVRLYSPRSSAASFLHAVTTSLHNVSTVQRE